MKKRFSIRYKILTIFLVFIIALILSILLVTGFQMRKSNKEQFHKNMQQNIKLIEYSINLFFDNTKQMLATLSDNSAVRSADQSFNNYTEKTELLDVNSIEKSAAEAAVFNLFKNIHANHPDYMCVFMGTKWGGYTSSALNIDYKHYPAFLFFNHVGSFCTSDYKTD